MMMTKEKTLNVYEVPVTFKMSGEIPVLAKSKDEAVQHIEQDVKDMLPFGMRNFIVPESFDVTDYYSDITEETDCTGKGFWRVLRDMYLNFYYTLENLLSNEKRCCCESNAESLGDMAFLHDLHSACESDPIVRWHAERCNEMFKQIMTSSTVIDNTDDADES